MKQLADRICVLLQTGRPAAVATILSRKGSAPRTAGSKMVVDDQGGFVGTIGGGKFEADVLTAAGQAIADGRPRKLFFDLTHDDVSAMDLICGGKMEVLVDVLSPEQPVRTVFQAWRSALTEVRRGALVTVLKETEKGLETAGRCMFFEGGDIVGGWPLPEALLSQMAETAASAGASRLLEAEEALIFLEPTAVPTVLFIFGAGHVSTPTARLAAEVGFQVVVIDDRRSFANRERFADAAEIRVPDNFASAFSGLSVDADSFVVIVTRGHRFDKEVLSQALRTEAGYIGMIGSRRKRNAIYAALKKEGFADADLARVHCPIGLSIGAESPEEIAVSIVAELIACRAERGKEHRGK